MSVCVCVEEILTLLTRTVKNLGRKRGVKVAQLHLLRTNILMYRNLINWKRTYKRWKEIRSITDSQKKKNK